MKMVLKLGQILGDSVNHWKRQSKTGTPKSRTLKNLKGAAAILKVAKFLTVRESLLDHLTFFNFSLKIITDFKY